MQQTEKKPLTAAQKRQQALRQRAWLRAAVQAVFFVSMPGAFVAGFAGVRQLFLRIGTGAVLQMDSFVLSLLGLCGFTILFGRFFCGYVCAFGSLGDFVYWVSGLAQKKLLHRKQAFRLPEKAVRWGAEGQVSGAGEHRAAVCGRCVWPTERLEPLGSVFPSDGAAYAACRVWAGHCAACADPARHGGAAALLLSVPVPDGSSVLPAAGAALRAAAPGEQPVHSGLQCLPTALPGGSEIGRSQPAQRRVHCL